MIDQTIALEIAKTRIEGKGNRGLERFVKIFYRIV